MDFSGNVIVNSSKLKTETLVDAQIKTHKFCGIDKFHRWNGFFAGRLFCESIHSRVRWSATPMWQVWFFFFNCCSASPESACVSNGVLLLGVSWPFVKSTANKTHEKELLV